MGPGWDPPGVVSRKKLWPVWCQRSGFLETRVVFPQFISVFWDVFSFFFSVLSVFWDGFSRF